MKYCTLCKEKYDDTVSFCPKDGEVLEDDPSSIVGTVLDGQYQIETLLGKGGMGAVYLARHILLGDRVAIKILPPHVRNNAEWLRRFRREGQAARRFRHANVVTVYDLRTASDGTIYMVMEYVEGHTLDAELKKRQRFTPAETFEILEPIMSALNTAHAMGVVHRDLKPENIMIGKANSGSDPQIKLLDLGIAKMREIAGVESAGTTELTMAGQVLGTPYYMSPEQWGEISSDGDAEIDGRADIYSLGLVAYQMITGQRAYSATTLHELRREHISVKPAPLDQKVPNVPKAFSQAIDRALEKDRNARQATAGELAEQLRESLKGAANASDARLQGSLAIPRPATSGTPTHSAPGGVVTNSDVNAATILTADAIPTSPPARPVSAPPAASAKPAPEPAVGEESVVTVLQKPKAKPEEKKSGGKPLVFVGAGVLVLILVVVGVGALLAYNYYKPKPTEPVSTVKTRTTTAPNTPATTEVGRYWLEVLPNELAAEPLRVAGTVPLKSGEAFKFHFDLNENGYLYIVGPGEGNKATAFLTDKPASVSGLDSNEVSKGSDFSFPNGIEHWLELDKKPGTENYTIIFSPTRLTQPAFFTSQATGKPLSDTENSELSEFLAKHQSSPVTEINDKEAAAPFVRVKVPQTTANNVGDPVIFRVRIDHK